MPDVLDHFVGYQSSHVGVVRTDILPKEQMRNPRFGGRPGPGQGALPHVNSVTISSCAKFPFPHVSSHGPDVLQVIFPL